MTINWQLVLTLFSIAIPGTLIAIPRMIRHLLPDNSETLVSRLSLLAIAQTLIMIFIMCLGGTVVSDQTGLSAPIINKMLQGLPFWLDLRAILLPTLLYSLAGLVVFLGLFYGLTAALLDQQTFEHLRRLHQVLRTDGTVFYGGIAEELMARWGLMNLVVFFGLLFAGRNATFIIWTAILLSSFLMTIGQLPAYFAAGCHKSKRFIYLSLLLNLWQGIVFGLLFWQYGLLSAILAHMLFHFCWSHYDKTKIKL